MEGNVRGLTTLLTSAQEDATSYQNGISKLLGKLPRKYEMALSKSGEDVDGANILAQSVIEVKSLRRRHKGNLTLKLKSKPWMWLGVNCQLDLILGLRG